MLAALALLYLVPVIYAGKRGLDWTWYNADLNPGLFNTGNGEVVAIYDYETYAPPSSNGNGGLGFIGMQRCYPTCDSSPVDQLAALQAAQGWATVFTINEADTNGVTPSEAAAWYIQYINPLNIKKALPSVTDSTQSGQGLQWVQQMISACAGNCYFDYINLHWYGTSFAQFQTYIELAHSTFPSYQLVITEFALQNPAGGQADQISFFQQAFSFLDGASYVQLYFPFVATSPSLLQTNDAGAVSFVGTGSCLYNDDGSVSAVGQLLIG